MLTSDLIQARLLKGEVRPRYIKAADEDQLALAGQLIEIYRRHQGRSRLEIDGELKALLGSGTAFQLHRALAKLLRDRCVFDTDSPVEPVELRRALFEAAAGAYGRSAVRAVKASDAGAAAGGAAPAPRFDRAALIQRLAADFGLSPDQLEAGLYADLKAEQTLVRFEECEAGWLLRRYNVALAQGVLLRATGMTLDIRGQSGRRYRELFRKIKFFQLLTRVSGSAKAGYSIQLDGPLSLFQASQKYGLQMASFLPTLLHFDGWKLAAQVRWGPKRIERTFRLEAGQLEPFGRHLVGQWQPEEIRAFPHRFTQLGSDWEISEEAELIDLDGHGVLVPDFVFRHPASGRVAHMEVLGFWRKSAVDSRLRLLRRHGPPNFILALSKRLAGGREPLDELPAEVYLFRSLPIARQVLKLLERIALPAG